MSERKRAPIPLEVIELPEGWTPLRMVAVVECLDKNGNTQLCVRYSPDLNDWIASGMLDAAHDWLKVMMRQTYRPLGEE